MMSRPVSATPIFRDWGRTVEFTEISSAISSSPKYLIIIFQISISKSYPKFDPFDYGWQTSVTKNYPIFEGLQPIAGVNAVTYSLTNHFIQQFLVPHRPDPDQRPFLEPDHPKLFFQFQQLWPGHLPQPHHRALRYFRGNLGLSGGKYRDGVEWRLFTLSRMV